MLQAIRFFMSTNLRVRGLKVKNSPQFHFRFDGCQNVHIELLNIKAPAGSPNTDGIHVENTNNVKIYNSAISNGTGVKKKGGGNRNWNRETEKMGILVPVLVFGTRL